MIVISGMDARSRRVEDQSKMGDMRVRRTEYFGKINELTAPPQAFLIEVVTPGGVVKPHFHPVRQFQVFVAGDGRIGKEGIEPVSVHYTDGYTPYGPIVAGDKGISFFTFRSDPSVETHVMPGSSDQLKRRPGRTRFARYAVHTGETFLSRGWEVAYALIGAEEDGLMSAGYQLSPSVSLQGPDPGQSGGQYYLVLGGSLCTGEMELATLSCLYLNPEEEPLRMEAGDQGLDILLLQFPRNVRQ